MGRLLMPGDANEPRSTSAESTPGFLWACPRCGAGMVEAKHGWPVMHVRRADKPKWRSASFTEVVPHACGACGYVEFYAVDPTVLRD